ncbi:MAG: membrane dipeptidase [Planctomycetes bacterium]|nr:membrane dipeptidase [Planctomycetota bacterium]
MTHHVDRRSFLGTLLATSTAATLRAAEPNSDSSKSEMLAAARQNDTIYRAREIAADILNPSPKELEHGMELHANSLVFDTYGFAPRAALDGDALREAAEAGASQMELQDLRESMTMTRYVTDANERAEFVQAWHASGVTCIFQNAGEEGQAPLTLLKRLSRFTYATDMMRDFMAKAATPDDIVSAKEQGRRCLYLTGNGVPLTQQWVSVEDELRYLTVFFQLGIRMMHLTYQRRNMIGDGCAESSNAGLSDFGRTVVAAMNKVGVIVDIAHSGWRTSLEAAQASDRPMVASHSTCTALHHHIRSKPDEVIKAIANSGGLIGICCIPRFLGGSGDIAALLDHVDHVVKTFGINHVGIGTDVSYTSRNSAIENKKIPRRPKSRPDWRSLWPPDPFKETAEGKQSIAWTNWPMFTVGLVQRGYSDDDIQKIIGGNMLRVARAALG